MSEGSAVTIVTSGEYSSYGVKAVVRWKSSASPREAADRYLAEHPEQREDYNFEVDQFVAWLMRSGFAEELESNELWIGGYGCVDPDIGLKKFQ